MYFTSREAVVALTEYYARGIKEIIILYGEKKAQYKEDAMDRNDFFNWNPRANVYTMAVENLEDDQVAMFFGDEAGYEMKQRTDINRELVPRKPYSPLFFSANAITLTNQIQIIIRFHGKPADIHENFDFIHATNYYCFSTDGLHTTTAALEAIITSELHYVGSKYPLTSVIRIKKFLARGYSINAGEQLKMMFQLSLLDLTDPVVLSNQLAGVDITYFNILIKDMMQAMKDPGFNITIDWITGKIDHVFNKIEHKDD
ncbi:MAG: hypothetical protein KAH32_08540 [Chlamydiia bacterium]|nr:hypothetical protein [Chlamydiia bacterium]